GKLPFKRRDVIRTFATLHELYDYKLARTPARDPDELMKLIHWCISQGFHDEALTHLDEILELSPGYQTAKAMKFQLELARDSPPVDPNVMLSSGEQVEPATLSSRRLDQARQDAQNSPLPLGMPLIP